MKPLRLGRRRRMRPALASLTPAQLGASRPICSCPAAPTTRPTNNGPATNPFHPPPSRPPLTQHNCTPPNPHPDTPRTALHFGVATISAQFDKECRTSRPVNAGTWLMVELLDSDKPAPEPDWIGKTRIKISDLILNRKLDSKESFPLEGRKFPKYYIRAKIDFKPVN